MRDLYPMTDESEVRDLIRDHPWATIVGTGPRSRPGPVAVHYPVLLDEDADGIVLLSHLSRRDAKRLAFGSGELMVIIYGPQGYISPSWYGLPYAVPTWDFAVVHAYGKPEALSTLENLAVLERLVDHFEGPLPNPFRLHVSPTNTAYAEKIVGGTVGYRLPVTRYEARDKMSQDKPAEVVDQIVAALRKPGPYHNEVLADRVERHRDSGTGM